MTTVLEAIATYSAAEVWIPPCPVCDSPEMSLERLSLEADPPAGENLYVLRNSQGEQLQFDGDDFIPVRLADFTAMRSGHIVDATRTILAQMGFDPADDVGFCPTCHYLTVLVVENDADEEGEEYCLHCDGYVNR